MAVDEPADALRVQRIGDGAGIDVHDGLRLARRRPPAGRAEQRRDAEPGEVRQREQAPAVHGILPVGTEALVSHVVDAKRVAVHDERRRALHVVHDRVAQQRRARGASEALPEQEIAVAALEVDRRAGRREAGEGASYAGSERLAQLVVAKPGIEEVSGTYSAAAPRAG